VTDALATQIGQTGLALVSDEASARLVLASIAWTAADQPERRRHHGRTARAHFVPALPTPAWQRGHQYTRRGGSPTALDLMIAPQRRQGRPARP
jgi:hypothetical protein